MKYYSISIVALLLLQTVSGLVIGIDFGTEWMKVGIVGGKAFEVVLNEQSTRKTPNMIAFDRGDFLLGVDAQNLLTRSPKTVFTNTQALLGRSWGDPFVQELQHFYQYELLEQEKRGIYSTTYNKEIFIPEEIAALLLTYARDIASKTGNTNIKDCVITIPSFWTQSQRQAILDAAHLAGLHVLSLLHENSAVALNYGTTREFTSEGSNVLFYDMGATSTKASLMHFKSILDSKTNKTSPQLQVLQVAWDTTLGGKQFDYRLAQHFVKLVKQQHNVDVSATANPRAFARILKESQRIKEILSANSEARVMIEGLTSDVDFKTDITRQQFEQLCSDLIERVTKPIDTILQASNLTGADLAGIEIVGGGLRIPKIQEELAKFVNRDLDKHLNGDEASVMGATFYAATQSSSFRVKDFKIKDATHYAVSVSIKSETGELDKATELFKPGNRLNSKKSLTFDANENFTIELTYQNSPLLPQGINHNLGTYFISGFPSTDLYNYTEKPKIHATCRLNTNGMVVVESVEAEITVITVTKVLEEKEKQETEEATNSDKDEEQKSENLEKDDNQPEETAQQEQTKSEEESTGQETDEIKKDVVEKINKKVHRVPLKITPIFAHGMTNEEIKESTKKLADIRKRTELKKEREREKNSVESYIYQTREKISDDEGIRSVTTEEQREEFIAKLTEAEEWLYGETSEELTASDFRTKLRELKSQGDAIQLRLQELTLRPKAIETVLASINTTLGFIYNVSETLETKEGEVEDIVELCQSILKWLDARQEEQKDLQVYEQPAFTSQDIYNKWKGVEAKVKTLLRRPKKKPPKPIINETESILEETETNNTIPTQEEEEVGQQKETQEEEEEVGQQKEAQDSQNQQDSQAEDIHDEL